MGRRRFTHCWSPFHRRRAASSPGLLVIRLSDRLFPRLDRGMIVVPVYWLARHVHRRRHSGAFGVLAFGASVLESRRVGKPATSASSTAFAIVKSHWQLGIYAVLLMTAFTLQPAARSISTRLFCKSPAQDDAITTKFGLTAVIYNIGAIIGGGISFGLYVRSFRPQVDHHHRFAAVCLPCCRYGHSRPTRVWFAVGAFFVQVMVQGAWGVIPVHLNELSPDDARGTFPGFVYQLGNLIASVNATLQAGIAAHYGGDYGIALAAVAGTVAVAIVVLTALGTEAKGIAFGRGADPARGSAAVSPAAG